MDGLNLFDGLAALVVFFSAFLAFSRGFIREIMSILGWVVAAVAAYALAPSAAPFVANLPYVGDILGGSCELAIIGAFILLFAVCLVLFSIISSFFSYLARLPAVSAVDKVAGFIFGVVRGVFLVAIILILNDLVLPADQALAIIDDSESQQLLANVKEYIEARLPSDAPSQIEKTYQNLMEQCRPIVAI